MSSALPKQNNFQLQPLYPKTVEEEKKALVHFRWPGGAGMEPDSADAEQQVDRA